MHLACLEDDALGEPLDVFWQRELDRQIVRQREPWKLETNQGLDRPELLAAHLHTLRWNCVTSTRPDLLQAPYRAGIEIRNYQLEPLRRALSMPRVALSIADDVGLGKTIEAGLILQELKLRQKIRRGLICCPASVVLQSREEMENRFGVSLTIFAREFAHQEKVNQGHNTNP